MFRAIRNSAICILQSAITVACSTAGPIIKRTEDFESSFLYGGDERTYQVHLPAGYDGAAPTPLLIAFHGAGGTGTGMRQQTTLDQTADSLGFIAVYPDGLFNRWFFGDATVQHGIDDIGFTVELLERLRVLLVVDEDRLYVTGFSNGGFLTHALACHLGQVLAGAAPVAATLPLDALADCVAPHPISVLLMLGTADGSVPFEGDSASGTLSGEASVRRWAEIARCDDTPTDELLADLPAVDIAVWRETFDGCASSTEVQLYRLEGERHRWPLGYFDASGTIAGFLLGHRR